MYINISITIYKRPFIREVLATAGEQSLNNVWRKRAFRQLARAHCPGGAKLAGAKGGDSRHKRSIDVFRERVDYSVENVVPDRKDFAENTPGGAKPR